MLISSGRQFSRRFTLPRIDRHLRITIGADNQCRVLVDALREILG